MADDSEVSLPKSTLLKSIKDLLPPDMRVAGDSVDLIVQCCNEFVHLISTQANEVSEAEKKNTINPEHILRALEQLGFNTFVDDVGAAWEEWKGEKKEHQKLASKKSAALDSGLTQEQLVELQRKLFSEARARTLSDTLPHATPAGGGADNRPPPPQQPLQGAGAPGEGGATPAHEPPMQQAIKTEKEGGKAEHHPGQQDMQQQQQGEPEALTKQEAGDGAAAAAAMEAYPVEGGPQGEEQPEMEED